MTSLWRIDNPEARAAILRPTSGLAVLLALQLKPRTGDVQDMVERIEAIDGRAGALQRRYMGGPA